MSDRARTIEEDAEAHVRPADDVLPAGEPLPAEPRSTAIDDDELLLPAPRRDELRRTWLEVQGSFIDEPQGAVRRADGLVQELLISVSEGFESARRDLEAGWQRGEGANTESLRLALRRYRALFERLLEA